MGLLVIIALMILIGIFLPRYFKDIAAKEGSYGREAQPKNFAILRNGVRGFCTIVALLCFFQTSFVIIGDTKVGHLKKIYMGKSMDPGRIIAMPWEKGPQARVLTAGFHFLPFIRVTHDIEELDIITIEQGKYGFLVAKDGKAMAQGQYIASSWDKADEMVNALLFMGYTDKSDYKGPVGTKGPQLTVLSPGNYRINKYLFDVFSGEATDVPIGHVAVVKSNVGERYKGNPILPWGVESTNLSVPIVPKGYKGVWADVLKPDRYYLNRKAYDITILPTQIQTWKYLGGYTRRYVDLVLTDDGKIEQKERSETVARPDDAADGAILLRVENWDVWQDARIQVQVTPENAPFVVAASGGIAEIEDKIMTPTFRSVMRNEVAREVTETRTDKDGKLTEYKRPRRVLDLLYKREGLETSVESKLIPEGAKYGLTVMEVRFGDPVVPPELLIPGKRKQLAESLVATYKQEKSAQEERVLTEKERSRANQQDRLMKSEIGITVANNNATAREKEGLGEKKYLEAVALGQEAQANVLGKEKAFELAYIKEVLAAATSNPDIIKYPGTLVVGAGGGLEGAAALLGRSNLNMGLKKVGEAK